MPEACTRANKKSISIKNYVKYLYNICTYKKKRSIFIKNYVKIFI